MFGIGEEYGIYTQNVIFPVLHLPGRPQEIVQIMCYILKPLPKAKSVFIFVSGRRFNFRKWALYACAKVRGVMRHTSKKKRLEFWEMLFENYPKCTAIGDVLRRAIGKGYHAEIEPSIHDVFYQLN